MKQKTSFSLGISPLPDNPDFVKFNKTFKETIDKFCKLEKPKLTKRTFSNNPWLTEGIIISITYKETLYNTIPGKEVALRDYQTVGPSLLAIFFEKFPNNF